MERELQYMKPRGLLRSQSDDPCGEYPSHGHNYSRHVTATTSTARSFGRRVYPSSTLSLTSSTNSLSSASVAASTSGTRGIMSDDTFTGLHGRALSKDVERGFLSRPHQESLQHPQRHTPFQHHDQAYAIQNHGLYRAYPAQQTMHASSLAAALPSSPFTTKIWKKKRRVKYLSEADRFQIVHRIERGEKQAALAKEYGVTRAAVCYLNKHREGIKTRTRHLQNQPIKSKDSPVKQRSDDDEDDNQDGEEEDPDQASPTTVVRLAPLPINNQEAKESRQQVRKSSYVSSKSQSSDSELDELPKRQDQNQRQSLPVLSMPARVLLSNHHPLQQPTISPAFSSTSPSPNEPMRASPLCVPPSLEQSRLDSNVHQISTRSMMLQLTTLQMIPRRTEAYQRASKRAFSLLLEESLGLLADHRRDICSVEGDNITGMELTKSICAIALGNNALPMLNVFKELEPASPTGFFSGALHLSDSKVLRKRTQPNDYPDQQRIEPVHFLLMTPSCWTTNVATAAINFLINHGRVKEEHIILTSVFLSSEVVRSLHASFPYLAIVCGTIEPDAPVSRHHEQRGSLFGSPRPLSGSLDKSQSLLSESDFAGSLEGSFFGTSSSEDSMRHLPSIFHHAT